MERTSDDKKQDYTAAGDSVTLINTLAAKGSLTDDDKRAIQRNVDHLEIILEYTDPDVKNSSDDKSSYTGAITTGKAYIAAN